MSEGSPQSHFPFDDEPGPEDASDPADETGPEAAPGDDDTADLEGRRLRLIPHTVDPALVFRFEFGPAILAQVLEKLNRLDPAPLLNATAEVAAFPGFYQLFRDGRSVYIGRTIRPVGQRLAEHVKKLRGRVVLDDMAVRYLFVEDLSLVGLSEDAMIAYFHPLGLDPWGKLGFGSKATGFGRATQGSKWHLENPADLELPVTAGLQKPQTLRQLIAAVGRSAPLVLSVPRKFAVQFDQEHPETFVIYPSKRPFDDWISEIESRLRQGWHINREAMAWYIVRDDTA